MIWLDEFLANVWSKDKEGNRTLVAAVYDEPVTQTHNNAFMMFLESIVRDKRDVESRCYDHYELLRTIEENVGLKPLGEADKSWVPIVHVWK